MKKKIKMEKRENEDKIDIDDWEIIHKQNSEEANEESKTIFDEFVSESDWDNNEIIYKNNILNQKWIKENKYLDINKFSENISSYHYFDSYISNLELKFKEKNYINILSMNNFFSNPNTKKLCRKGVPPMYINSVLLKLFDIEKINENNYNKLYAMIFKDHDVNNIDDYVPYFTGKKTLKDSLPFHYLNEEGILELKIILWMVNEIYRNVILYCPILVKIISLILIFCNKFETFEIVCKLINSEKEKKSKEKEKLEIKKRLKFTKNDNIYVIDSIESCMNEVNYKRKNEYNEIFKKIQFNKRELYEDIFNCFLINYLNFYGIIRFLPLFLREGFKSVYRLICSLENYLFQDEIKFNNKNEVINILREKSKKIDVNELFKNSFNYKFKTMKIKEDTDEIINENNEFYLPNYNGGDLLSDYEIIHLWELFPLEYKIKNANIIYQANKDGYNLPNILELEEKYNKNIYILFLIQTQQGDKFGFVNSNLLTYTNSNYLRPNSTYLFTIRPEFKIYAPREDSDEILYITSKDFIFGNGIDGPAIHLNQDIREGVSYGGGCFNNPCLVNNPEGHLLLLNWKYLN